MDRTQIFKSPASCAAVLLLAAVTVLPGCGMWRTLRTWDYLGEGFSQDSQYSFRGPAPQPSGEEKKDTGDVAPSGLSRKSREIEQSLSR